MSLTTDFLTKPKASESTDLLGLETRSYAEALQERAFSPYSGTYASTFDIGPYSRFFSGQVHPEFGIDYLNKVRADRQSGWEQVGAMLNQAVTGKLIGGTLEGIGYLVDVAQTYNVLRGTEQEFGNWLSDIGKSLRTWTQESTPIHISYEPGRFRPDKLSWWMSNIPSFISTLSLLIPAGAVVKGLGAAVKAMGIMRELSKSVKALKLAGKLDEAAALSRKIQLGNRLFNSAVGASTSRLMENGMESAGKYDEMINKGYTAEQAGMAARQIWINNWALIAQDMVQWATLGKSFGLTKGPTSAAAARALGKSAAPAAVRGVGDFAWQMATEGFEEMAQYAISQQAEYAVRKSLNPDTPKTTFGEYLRDGEMWTNFVFGALGGGLFHAVGTSNAFNPAQKRRLQEQVHAIKSWPGEIGAAVAKVGILNQLGDKVGAEAAVFDVAAKMAAANAELGLVSAFEDRINELTSSSPEELQNLNFSPENIKFLKDNKSELLKISNDVLERTKHYSKSYIPQIASRLAALDAYKLKTNEVIKEHKANAETTLNSNMPWYQELSPIGKELVKKYSNIQALSLANASLSHIASDKKNYDEAGRSSAQKRQEKVAEELKVARKELVDLYNSDDYKSYKDKDATFIKANKMDSKDPSLASIKPYEENNNADYDNYNMQLHRIRANEDALNVVDETIVNLKKEQLDINAGVIPDPISQVQTDPVPPVVAEAEPQPTDIIEADERARQKKEKEAREKAEQSLQQHSKVTPTAFGAQIGEFTQDQVNELSNSDVEYLGKTYKLSFSMDNNPQLIDARGNIATTFSDFGSSLEDLGVTMLSIPTKYDHNVAVNKDNKPGFTVGNNFYSFLTENALEALQETKDFDLISVTVKDEKGKKVTFDPKADPAKADLVEEIALTVALVEEERATIVREIKKEGRSSIEVDQHPVYFTHSDGKVYKIYYDNKTWTAYSYSGEQALKPSTLRSGIFNNFFSSINDIINGEDKSTSRIRQGSEEELNRTPDITSLPKTPAETTVEVQPNPESNQEGVKQAGEIHNDKIEEEKDRIIEELNEEEANKANLSPIQQYDGEIGGTSISAERSFVTEPEMTLNGQIFEVHPDIHKPNEGSPSELGLYLENPKNDLRNAYLEFDIDFNSEYALAKYWPGREDLRRKLLSGTPEERATLLQIHPEDIGKYNLWIDNIPLVGTLYDGGKAIPGRIMLGISGVKPEFYKHYYQNRNLSAELRGLRRDILSSLFREEKLRFGDLFKDQGHPYKSNKKVKATQRVVSDVFRSEDPNTTELAVQFDEGMVRDASGSTVFISKNPKYSGAVYMKATKTANGSSKWIKLNKVGISQEHAGMIFDIYKQTLSSVGGSINQRVNINGITGLRTAKQVLDALVHHGGRTTKWLPIVDRAHQMLYVHGKKLYYGKDNEFLFAGKSEDQISAERKKFIDWAISSKPYAIDFDKLKNSYEKPFTIGKLTYDGGLTYEGFLLTHGYLTTDIEARDGNIFTMPKLHMRMSDSNVIPVSISPQEKKQEIAEPENPIDNILGDNTFTHINHFYDAHIDYEKESVSDSIKSIRKIVGKNIPIEVEKELLYVMRGTGTYNLFGLVRDASVKLAEDLEIGTGYHEAFHIVSLFYLTEEERQSLYADYRNQYKKPKLSDKEVNEDLAEEFRKYKVAKDADKSITGIVGKVADFFSRVYNSIKSLFISTQRIPEANIQRVFRAMERGRFQRASVLSENLEKFKGQDFAHKSNVFTNKQIRTITDGLLFELLQLNNVMSVDSISNMKMEPLHQMVKDRYARLLEVAERIKEDKTKEQTYNDAIHYSDVYRKILDNFEDGINFVSRIDDKLLQLDIRRRSDSVEDPSGTSIVYEGAQDIESRAFAKYTLNNYEFNGRDTMLTNVKLFIASIPSTREKDPFTRFPIFEDFNTSWSRIMHTLWDSSDIYDIMGRLETLSKNPKDFFYKVILDGIRDPKTQEYTRLGLKNGSEIFRTQFLTSIKKYKHNYVTLLYSQHNGQMTVADANINKLSRQSIKIWNEALASDDSFFEGDERKFKTAKLNVLADDYNKLNKDILTEYLNNAEKLPNIYKFSERLIKLLDRIHIPVNNEILDLVFTNETASYDFNFKTFVEDLGKLIGNNGGLHQLASDSIKSKGITINNIYNQSKVVKQIAEAITKASPDVINTTILGPNNNIYYLYASNTFATNLMRDLTRGTVNSKELIQKKLTNTFSSNSQFLKQIDSGVRGEFVTLSALRSGRDATGYRNFTPDTDFVVRLNAILQGYLPLPTLANRPAFYFYKGFKPITITSKDGNANFELDKNGHIVFGEEILDIFEGYFQAETKRIEEAKEAIKEAEESGNYKYLVNNYHYTLDKKGNMVFNGNALKYVLFKEFNGTPYSRTQLEKILRSRVKDTIQYALDKEIIGRFEETTSGSTVSGLTNNKLSMAELEKRQTALSFSESQAIETVMAEYTLNYIMSMIETQMIFAGDPAMYSRNPLTNDYIEDFTKRVTAIMAPGDSIRSLYKDGEFAGKTTFDSITVKTKKKNVSTEEYYKKLHKEFIRIYKKEHPNLTKEQSDILADAFATDALSAYKSVDYTDGQVFVTPKFYREFRKRVGDWNEDVDEKAYNILMSNKKLTVDDVKAISHTFMYPLKPVYFELAQRRGIEVPIFDKMSMATAIPRFLNDNSPLKKLFTKMMEEDIGVLKFDSAVKVGLGNVLDIEESGIDNLKSYSFSQNFDNLLRQQITETHDSEEVRRALATQFKRLAYGILRSSTTYTVGERTLSGAEVARVLTLSYNALSDRGREVFDRKLGIKDGKINIDKLYQVLESSAIKSNMPINTLEAVRAKVALDAMPDRKWPQAQLIALNGKHTVDITTPGDAYYQVSNYGLEPMTSGKLKLIDSQGRMEVALSINLFRNVIPEYATKTHEERVSWIQQEFEGLGYRIPTQCPSSIVAFVVKEFFPETTGNTIVLPSEFTTLTGSDFDIDKLFLARYNYNRRGERIEFIDGDDNSDFIQEDNLNKWEQIYQQHTSDSIFLRQEMLDIYEEYDEEFFAQALLKRFPDKFYRSLIEEKVKENFEVLNDWNLSHITEDQFKSVLHDLSNIPTYEDFIEQSKNKTVYELNTRKAIENHLLATMFASFIHPDHIRSTKTPLDYFSKRLKDVAREINKLEEKSKNLAGLEGISPVYQIGLKQDYIESGSTLSTFAIQNVAHALSQTVNLKLKFKEYRKNAPAAEFVIGKHDGVWTSISEYRGVDDVDIIDWFSALISASVDVVKDSYLFDLNVNRTTADVTSFLLRSGVGINTFWFINQPGIKENLELFSSSESQLDTIKSESFMSDFEADIAFELLQDSGYSPSSSSGKDTPAKRGYRKAQEYLSKAKDLASAKGIKEEHVDRLFNVASSPNSAVRMKEGSYRRFIETKAKDRDWNWYAVQGGLLKAYTRMLTPTQLLTNVTLGTRVDNKAYGNNMTAVRMFADKIANLRAKEGIDLSNFEAYMDNTFLGRLMENSVDYMNKVFVDTDLTSTKGFQQIVKQIFSDTVGLIRNSDTIEKISDQVYSSLAAEYFLNPLGYGLSKKDVINLFSGDSSVGAKLAKLKDTNNEYYSNNKFLSSLTPKLDSYSKFWFIESRPGDRSDAYSRDIISEDWSDMLSHPDDTIRTLGKELVYYSFFTSGFNRSIYTFYHNLPWTEVVTAPTPFSDSDITQSFNDYIKDTIYRLQHELLDNDYVYSKIREVMLHNTDLLPEVQVGMVKSNSKIDTILSTLDNQANYFVGYNAGSEYMFNPYIKVNLGDGKEAILHYVGYYIDKGGIKPYYTSISSKGAYLSKGHHIKEFGLKGKSIIPANTNAKDYNEHRIREQVEALNSNDVRSFYIEPGDRFVTYREAELPDTVFSSFENTETVSEIYSKLGNKTKEGNVVIQSVYQTAGVQYAKSIGGVFSLRVNGTNNQFGNPFSSVESEIQKGLIRTKSTKESVEKYIEWVLSPTTTIKPEQHGFIREWLQSGKLKNRPIVYYKELGEPSHATALDYLINRYNWNQQENKLPYSESNVIKSDPESKQIETAEQTQLETSILSDEQLELVKLIPTGLSAEKRDRFMNAIRNNMPKNEFEAIIKKFKEC